MVETIWSIIPPVIAIVLALATKEVYLSLMIGVMSGTLIYTGFNPVTAVETMFKIMGGEVGGNMNLIFFLVFLGIIVSMLTKTGASQAYANWATRFIKGKRGALLATTALGVIIFVDDYFNCLTVGTVMKPITDKYNISRAKLAFVIDATAAPVCIIAPVSSWAAAVGSSLPENSGIDGFMLFLRTIPFNLYALLMLVFMLYLSIRGVDYGAMRRYEEKLRYTKEEVMEEESDLKIEGSGKVKDLIIPIVVLVAGCILAMLYTGGLFKGVGVAKAFAECDPTLGLALGTFFVLIFTFLFYVLRRVITFKTACESFVAGAKSMMPAIMILSLAWTLSGICGAEYLNLGGYVGGLIGGNMMLTTLLPAIFFLVAVGLSFATGTSWGTFGIMIPIGIAVLGTADVNQLAIAVAAILAGAVCGDHCSPISDTTILSSTGAQCKHLNHVSTQLPYAMTVAGCCLPGYIVSGITQNGWLGLLTGLIIMIVILIIVARKPEEEAA